MNKNLKDNKAITLVALTVTIIILIIISRYYYSTSNSEIIQLFQKHYWPKIRKKKIKIHLIHM